MTKAEKAARAKKAAYMKKYNANKKKQAKASSKKKKTTKSPQRKEVTKSGIADAKSLLGIVAELESKLDRIAGLSESLGFHISLPGFEKK